MDRRKALKNLGLLTGGVVLFPSCDFSEEKVSLALNKLSITESQETLMKELVGCIIPEGDIPGAVSLNVHEFVWVMVDDCMDEPSQKSYLAGLNNFDKNIKNRSGKRFGKLNPEDRITALSGILEKTGDTLEPEDQDLVNFVQTTKNFTSLGYMRSEYMMTEVMPYTLVPGTYGPCETIDNSKRINING